MIPNCERHRWDPSEDECRHCGQAYCGSCLVYTNGTKARPMCIQCALKVSGIRGSKKTRPTWRERRARTKVDKAAARHAEPRPEVEVAAATNVEPLPEVPPMPQPGWVSLDANLWDVGRA